MSVTGMVASITVKDEWGRVVSPGDPVDPARFYTVTVTLSTPVGGTIDRNDYSQRPDSYHQYPQIRTPVDEWDLVGFTVSKGYDHDDADNTDGTVGQDTPGVDSSELSKTLTGKFTAAKVEVHAVGREQDAWHDGAGVTHSSTRVYTGVVAGVTFTAGAFRTITAPGQYLFVYDGTAFQPAEANVWDGAAFVPAEVNVYDGAGWVK